MNNHPLLNAFLKAQHELAMASPAIITYDIYVERYKVALGALNAALGSSDEGLKPQVRDFDETLSVGEVVRRHLNSDDA